MFKVTYTNWHTFPRIRKVTEHNGYLYTGYTNPGAYHLHLITEESQQIRLDLSRETCEALYLSLSNYLSTKSE